MIASQIRNGELVAVAYTEIPLRYDEAGRLLRVEKEEAKSVARATLQNQTGKPSNGDSPNFYLVTSVSRGYKISSGANKGKYKYTCNTVGTWSKNSFLSGSKYPASGKDFIMQATPSNMVRYDDDLSPTYSHNHDAVEGEDFHRYAGGDNFVQYSVKDDPLGLSQLKKVYLTSYCYAKEKTGRRINSYYIHTWKSLSISVTATVGKKDDNTSLSTTPSIKKSNWQCYNYVQFDF